MDDLILQITMGLVPSRITYWLRNRAVGQGRGLLAQRRGRDVAGSAGHRDRTPPDLATTPIHRYSKPGDLVVEPVVGTETMLVEALHQPCSSPIPSGDGEYHDSTALPSRDKTTYYRRPARRALRTKPAASRLQQSQDRERTASPCPPYVRHSPVSGLSDRIGRPSAHGTSRPQPDPATTAGSR